MASTASGLDMGGLTPRKRPDIEPVLQTGAAMEPLPTGDHHESKQPAPKRRIHELSRKLARDRGCTVAAVLRGLAYKVQVSNNQWQGKRWYYDPLEKLAERWPYVPPSTLFDMFKKLEKDGLVYTGKNNKKTYDRTTWYSMSPDAIKKAAEDLISFDVNVAVGVDVEAAVLYHHLRYSVESAEATDEGDEYAEMSPAKLSERVPITRSNVKRKLRKLEAKGFIARHPDKKGFWTVVKAAKCPGSKPDENGSNPEIAGSDSDVTGSNPDNNTHYETIRSPLGKPIKEHPPPADASSAKMQNDQIESIEHNDIAAGGLCDSWDDVERDNEIYNELFEGMADNAQSRTIELIDLLVCLFIQQIPFSDLKSIYSSKSRDFAVRVVYQFLRRTVMPTAVTYKELANGIPEYVESMCVYLLVKAFADHAAKVQFPNHPIGPIQKLLYPFSLEISKRFWREDERQSKLQHERAQITFASRDKEKESLTQLAPAEKARVFRNALNERNRVGFLGKSGQITTDFIEYSRHNVQHVKALFDKNPDVSVSDLLRILDRCIAIFKNNPGWWSKRPDPNFFSRLSYSIGMFLKYLDKVCDELGERNPFENFESTPTIPYNYLDFSDEEG